MGHLLSYYGLFDARIKVSNKDLPVKSQPDNEYKFVLVYQDHLSKFVILRPLKRKTAEEVVEQFQDIFCLLGAPLILQSDNGR
jgi:hypothetical protein